MLDEVKWIPQYCRHEWTCVTSREAASARRVCCDGSLVPHFWDWLQQGEMVRIPPRGREAMTARNEDTLENALPAGKSGPRDHGGSSNTETPRTWPAPKPSA